MRSRDDAGRELLDRAATRLRRATLIPVLLLVPLIFLPLRNPAEALAARPLLRQQRTGFESRASSAALLFLLPYSVLAGLASGERFVFAERFLYLPSVGLCRLVALAVGAVSTGRLPGREPRRSGPPSGAEARLAVFTLAAMISGFSILTWARCLEWREIGPTQGTVSRAIRFGENGSSCAGGFPSTIQRDR